MQSSSRVKAWTRSAIALLSGFALLGCAPANLSGAAVSPAPSRPARAKPSSSALRPKVKSRSWDGFSKGFLH
ncbi:MAG: hypothetical protein SNJ57_10905 [Cyanobacteriota bacterium]